MADQMNPPSRGGALWRALALYDEFRKGGTRDYRKEQMEEERRRMKRGREVLEPREDTEWEQGQEEKGYRKARRPTQEKFEEERIKGLELGNESTQLSLDKEREAIARQIVLQTMHPKSLPVFDEANNKTIWAKDESARKPFAQLTPDEQANVMHGVQQRVPTISPTDVAKMWDANVYALTGAVQAPKVGEGEAPLVPHSAQTQPGALPQVSFQAIQPMTATPIKGPNGEESGLVRVGDQIREAPNKMQEGDKTFLSNAQTLLQSLNGLEAVVKDDGNWESVMGNQKSAALLGQLPYQIAIAYAKIVDPTSVAREGEVQAAQKYMIPMGLTVRDDKTLAAIENMKTDLQRRVQEYQKVSPKLPPAALEQFLKPQVPGSLLPPSALPPSYQVPGTNAPAQAIQSEQLPIVTSPAEYDALPKGTRYKDVLGKTGIKN